MKIKYVHLILLFLIMSKIILAQENYVKGYIITNNNDSITGMINFKTDEQNGQSCRFKLSETAPEQLFLPGDILEYRFINEGKYYVSHEVIIDSIPRRVFLEYLVDGVMNLYFYRDAKTHQDYYFFEDESGQVTSIEKNQHYIGALTYLFRDYPTIRKKLSKDSYSVAYRRGNMVELAKEYHKETCSPGQECIVFTNDYKRQYLEFKFSAYAGFQIMDYSIKRFSLGITEETLSRIIYTPGSMNSWYPTVGGRLFINNPRWTNSLGLLIDIGVSKIKGDAQNSFIYRSYLKEGEFNFSALILTGKLDVKYIYPKGKIRPTAEAGFSYYNFFNKSSRLYFKEYDYNPPVQIIDIKNYDNFPASTLFGFNCGIGIDYRLNNNKSVFCCFSYDNANTARYISMGDANSNHNLRVEQIKIGYTF